MTRFTVDRSAIRAEVERRKAVVAPTSIPNPPDVSTTSAPKRWSAKVFVVPAAVAEALAKLASRTMHGIVEPHVGERHSMRRHRGVYIWRPAMDQQIEPDIRNELVTMPDVSTAETEIQKLKQKPH